MYRCIDGRNTKKTFRLMVLAEIDPKIPVIACSHPARFKEKAEAYGIQRDIIFCRYEEIPDYKDDKYSIYIDELECYMRTIAGVDNIAGYCMSIE